MVVPLPDLIFEHRIYGAFGGVAIAAGTLITTHFRGAIVAMTVALIAALGVRTYERSAEWNQEIPFLESHVAEFPDHPYALSFLALHYAVSEQVIRSIEVLRHAQDNLDRFNDYYMRPGSLAIGLNLLTAQMAMGDLEATGEVLEQLQVIGSDEPAFAQSQANGLLGGSPSFGMWRKLGTGIRWFIPVRFRAHVIFGMLLMFFAITFVCGKFVWSTARQRWFHG